MNIGSRVRLTKKIVSEKLAWTEKMDECIGRVGTIVSKSHGLPKTAWRVKINGDTWAFLEESLELVGGSSITFKQAKTIIKIACPSWKKKLATLWGYNLALGEDVFVSSELKNEMFTASNTDQDRILSEIFGTAYHIGQTILINDRKYKILLTNSNEKSVILLNVVGLIRWKESIKVLDVNKITKDEMMVLTGGYEFTLIK